MRLAAVTLSACLLAGCSHEHVFEVDTGGLKPQRSTLTLYGETTDMQQVGNKIVGRRKGSDGSGAIRMTFARGSSIECRIGYVTSGESEPHRFAVRDGNCIPNG